MSVVTGVIICSSVCEDFGSQGEDGMPLNFERINQWLAARNKNWQVKMIEDYCGGTKHPQMYVAGGGFNFFDEEDFLEWFKSIEWQCPENVVLIMEPEEGATMVWRPTEYMQ